MQSTLSFLTNSAQYGIILTKSKLLSEGCRQPALLSAAHFGQSSLRNALFCAVLPPRFIENSANMVLFRLAQNLLSCYMKT